MKAMILAAGIGSRLKPLTDSRPKALVEINGKSLLEIQINKLQGFGFNEFIINVHHFADMIIEYLKAHNNFGARILISDEREQLLDTGGAIRKARELFDQQTVLIHNVDIITNTAINDFITFHKQNNNKISLLVRNRMSSRLLTFNEHQLLSGWKNIKSGDEIINNNNTSHCAQFAFSGIHVLEPVAYNELPDEERFPIFPFYLRIAEKLKVSAFVHNEDFWKDVGKMADLEEIQKSKIV